MVMAYIEPIWVWPINGLYGFGLYSYGIYSHCLDSDGLYCYSLYGYRLYGYAQYSCGLYSDVLYSYGLYSYGLYSFGLYSYDLYSYGFDSVQSWQHAKTCTREHVFRCLVRRVSKHVFRQVAGRRFFFNAPKMQKTQTQETLIAIKVQPCLSLCLSVSL